MDRARGWRTENRPEPCCGPSRIEGNQVCPCFFLSSVSIMDSCVLTCYLYNIRKLLWDRKVPSSVTSRWTPVNSLERPWVVESCLTFKSKSRHQRRENKKVRDATKKSCHVFKKRFDLVMIIETARQHSSIPHTTPWFMPKCQTTLRPTRDRSTGKWPKIMAEFLSRGTGDPTETNQKICNPRTQGGEILQGGVLWLVQDLWGFEAPFVAAHLL